ncbi:MAG: rhodanese-like domain-containing protein [Steroidobacteraceae bacterium]
MRRLPLLLLLASTIVCAAEAGEPPSIEPKTVGERLAWGDQSLVVLDVRTPAEYAEGHVPGALNIPHTELAARIAELSAARSRDIVVYCRSGNRTAQALKLLGDAGFTRLFHLKGDYLRWSEKERPVTRTQ